VARNRIIRSAPTYLATTEAHPLPIVMSVRHPPPHPDLPPGCEPRCPGCHHRHLSATASEARKQAFLHRLLAPWQDRLGALEAVSGAARHGYRDRVCLHAHWRGDGWDLGLLTDDTVVPIPHCPVHSTRVRQSARLLADALPPMPLAYLVQAGAQLTLVLKDHHPPPLDWLDHTLITALGDAGVEGLWLHLNPSAGRRLFLKRGWRLLHGQPRSRNRDGLWYGPAAFQQPIPALARRVLDLAEQWLAPGPERPLLDLYCGRGAGLVRWGRAGATCLGVELGAEAVACARDNAPQAIVLQGACATRLPQLEAWRRDRRQPPAVYLNPPRTGLEAALLDWLVESCRAPRLAYLSCSAGTLARDLTRLEAGGYRLARLQPYDFFPQTHHVETLALLERVDNPGDARAHV